jgi:hypothetical protein
MVPSVTPTPNNQAFESIFRDAFTAERQRRFDPLTSIDGVPNRACGDAIDPDFD